MTNADQLDQFSRVWLRNAFKAQDLAVLDQACDTKLGAGSRLDLSGSISSVLGSRGPIANALKSLMKEAFPTRIVAFDKTPDHNWSVPWHQDRVIAVAERSDVQGCSNWSHKGNTWHCEPSIDVLEHMLFIRVHLDDDIDGNGAMQIALGSHKQGRVAASDAQHIAERHDIETCVGKRGDILVLKMLTLHRSPPAQSASTRRVLRIDYANKPLPSPLAWPEASQ